MISLSKKYLLAYNLAQAIGWTIALVQLVQGTIKRNSFRDAYDVGGALICKPSIFVQIFLKFDFLLYYVCGRLAFSLIVLEILARHSCVARCGGDGDDTRDHRNRPRSSHAQFSSMGRKDKYDFVCDPQRASTTNFNTCSHLVVCLDSVRSHTVSMVH